ncbi:hypothetical protein BDP81DRAFT_420046 [Colletotrichum phormii]|uniref:Uncharacterized protein n=1 Tax=Colletotrichum phormii TaxID=359342 RepID=A0AAJ0EIX3_9PEZI|nr:uncharacterized protein BDP81DRAFT_420046 [Colletotrichum phormii]KAK1640434.1 hypothetical protein BDP81DRAFT_420046 [Colletotrichum phormii]
MNLSRPPHHPPPCPCLSKSLVRRILWLGSPGRRRQWKLVCRHHPVVIHVETLDRRWRLSKKDSISTTHLTDRGRWRGRVKSPFAVAITGCFSRYRLRSSWAGDQSLATTHNPLYLYLPITQVYSCQHTYVAQDTLPASLLSHVGPSFMALAEFPPHTEYIRLVLAWKPTPL